MTKTVRFECVGGPRDGAKVRIQQGVQTVVLDGELYHRCWWIRRDRDGRRLWEKECLVWIVTLRGDDPLHPQPPLPLS